MPGQAPGYTFAPNFEQAQQSKSAGQAAAPAGTIQTLNFRLPPVMGANAPSPLVTDQFQGGVNNAVLEAVLRRVFGQIGQGQPSPAQAGAPSYAPPSFEGNIDVPADLQFQNRQPRGAQPWGDPRWSDNPFTDVAYLEYLRNQSQQGSSPPPGFIVDATGQIINQHTGQPLRQSGPVTA